MHRNHVVIFVCRMFITMQRAKEESIYYKLGTDSQAKRSKVSRDGKKRKEEGSGLDERFFPFIQSKVL